VLTFSPFVLLAATPSHKNPLTKVRLSGLDGHQTSCTTGGDGLQRWPAIRCAFASYPAPPMGRHTGDSPVHRLFSSVHLAMLLDIVLATGNPRWLWKIRAPGLQICLPCPCRRNA
jgi:hypothetical protein